MARASTWSLLALALALALPASAQERPFVVVEDDDTLTTPIRTGRELANATQSVLRAYLRSGAPLPEVLSVWTAFPIGGDSFGTFYTPIGNDIRGIGLERVYQGQGVDQGTFPSDVPPLRGVLLHNDFTALAARARFHRGPLEGYGRYLFLLELSHVWGPSIRLDGAASDALLGSEFHWSFYLDAGTSPAGGNAWIDRGEGRFEISAQSPSTVRFSALDLYLMGLVPASEVAPFGLLVNVEPPADATDPFYGGPLSARTYPWFSEPIGVRARRQTVTIEDVVRANGPRTPAYPDAPREWTLGIVLVVPNGTSDARRDELADAFEPFARTLAPSFHDATGERGSLRVIATSAPPAPDAGPPLADAGTTDDAGSAPAPVARGCAVSVGRSECVSSLGLLAIAALVAMRRRRARR